MSGNIFQIEPVHNTASYELNIYYKRDSSHDSVIPLKRFELKESDLEELTEENFSEKTGVDLDPSNPEELRNFIAEITYIQAKAKGLILLSFDMYGSLRCRKWWDWHLS